MKIAQNKPKTFSLLCMVILTILVKCANNLKIPDETGGYSVVVAVDPDIPEPAQNGTADIIKNIQTTWEAFSRKLWDASNHTFYIRSIDILIPNTWKYDNSSITVNQNFQDAGVRLMSGGGNPYVENPKRCGEPGEHIDIPFSMFNSSDTDASPYGPMWKVLLNLWATYRWGVYEEHGYVGDIKFPYVYRDLSVGRLLVTGCSDHPLEGRFLNLDNSSQECPAQDTLNSNSSCRFIPETIQNATTSLMHFHWIDSIVHFCDERSHNKLSPNRQNSLCDHKSVWEVIRETKDFKAVNNPISDQGNLPNISFQVVQHSPKPILYILLDDGRIQSSINLANLIPRALINFLANTQRSSTVAAIGKYSDYGGQIFKDIVEWTTIGANLDKFADAIGNLHTNGSIKRDFSLGVPEAVRKIKAKGHPNGVVMLVVKYGADLDNLETHMPEFELYNDLNEQGIILSSIELQMTNHSGHAHLSELSQQTGGIYTVINNYATAETSLNHVFNFLHKTLNENYQDLRKNFRTLLKSSISSGSPVRISVPLMTSTPEAKVGKIQIYFSTLDSSLGSQDFVVEGINRTTGDKVPVTNMNFKKRQDWFEPGSKWTYLLEISTNQMDSISEFEFRTTCVSCRGQVLVRTDIKDNESQKISINVFTNKENAIIDLENEGPMIIYAKILKSGAPVENALVSAVISFEDSFLSTEIPLNDKGDQSPDEQSEDGIYSGYFIPEVDGKFRISVKVKGDKSTDRGEKRQQIERGTRLLPVNQTDMGCSTGAKCDLESLPGEFMQTVDFSAVITIRGSAQYIPEPAKVASFFTRKITEENQLELLWIAPSVPGSFSRVSDYDIRQSQSHENLIVDFENQEKIPLPPGKRPGDPGSLEMLTLPFPSSTTFYAIKSSFSGKLSKLSDVQGVEVASASTTTTVSPTVSTTISPTTISSTITTSTSTESPTTSSTESSSSSTSQATTVIDDSTTTSTTTTTSNPTLPTSAPTSEPEPTSTTPPKNEDDDDKKPWAKRSVGIAIITVSVIVAVIIILILVYIIWRKLRRSHIGKINPPPQSPKTSIPNSVSF